LFLGSNSQKTVEYFSKALGEKTIFRNSVSVNKDRGNWRTGMSVSDQVMARALMTPDELRRLDNDLCIIFEKGVKPIKANKFYYFKHPMAKEMARLEIDHNDLEDTERGGWRKFNPYNPWTEESENKREPENLKVESLDDLFDDEPKAEKVEQVAKTVPNPIVKPIETIQEPAALPLEIDEDDSYDLQKELEAKFDELFGPLDDE
jgi:type IV secretory pathway TraG/TraD family ATPase VirD4